MLIKCTDIKKGHKEMKKRILFASFFAAMLSISAFALEPEPIPQVQSADTEFSASVDNPKDFPYADILTRMEDDVTRDFESPQLEEVYFFADGKKATEKANQLVNMVNASEGTNFDDFKSCENFSLVVRYSLPDPAEPYAITVRDLDNEMKNVQYYPLGNRSKTKRRNQYLDVFSFGDCTAGRYLVTICSETENDIQNVAEESATILELAEIEVDFGAFCLNHDTLRDVLANHGFYSQDDTKRAQKSQIRFIADTQCLPSAENKMTAETSLHELISFVTDYEELFSNCETAKWLFHYDAPDPAIFSWRVELPVANIEPAGAYQEWIRTDQNVITGNLPEDSLNVIHITADDLPWEESRIYESGRFQNGYWVGVIITAPKGAESAYYGSAGDAASLFDLSDRERDRIEISDFNGTVSFCCDLASDGSLSYPFFCIQFFGKDEIPLTETYYFEINFEEVVLNTTIPVNETNGIVGKEDIERGIYAVRFNAEHKNDTAKNIIIDATGLNRVSISSDAAALLTKTCGIDMEIETQYGTVFIPQDMIDEIFSTNGVDLSLEMLENIGQIEDALTPSSSRACSLNTYHVQMLKGLEPFDLEGKLIVSLTGTPGATNGLNELWAIRFDPENTPEIIDKKVMCDHESRVAFEIDSFGWYAVVEKGFAESMGIFEDDGSQSGDTSDFGDNANDNSAPDGGGSSDDGDRSKGNDASDEDQGSNGEDNSNESSNSFSGEGGAGNSAPSDRVDDSNNSTPPDNGIKADDNGSSNDKTDHKITFNSKKWLIDDISFNDTNRLGTDSVDFEKGNVNDDVSTAIAQAKYDDVPVAEWFHAAIVYITQQGMMSGNQNHFFPNALLTRGMMAQILYNMEGSPPTEIIMIPDVPASEWYTPSISWAFKQELMSGYSNGNFGPDDFITREQLASILERYARKKNCFIGVSADVDIFSDSENISDWAERSVSWAVGAGLITGKGSIGGLRLDPSATVTRAEAAQILMNFDRKLIDRPDNANPE